MSMVNLRFFRKVAAAAAGASLALAITAGALAHVTVNPGEAPANSYARLDFRVGHGCEGSPTTSVRIQIPEGVTSVRPQLKPGWENEIVVGPLAEPYESHGELITEGVTEVTWSGGELSDDYFDDFGLSVRLPDLPGETLYFPVIQECVDGEIAWIQVPAEGDDGAELDEPAPGLLLVASSGDSHGHGGDDEGNEASVSNGSGESSTVLPAQAASSDSDNTLAWIALAVGVVGVLAGGTGMLMATRSRS